MRSLFECVTRADDGFRSTEFSPDGSFLLSVDTCGTVFLNTLNDLNFKASASCRDITKEVISFRDGASVLSTCWYLYTTRSHPETCCFLTASRDHPIRLRDAFTGKVRASYTAYDEKRDQIISPHALTFHPNGTTFYGGFENQIRIFDLQQPGRECDILLTTSSRRSQDGYKGIVSALTLSPHDGNVLVAGTFSSCLAFYDTRTNEPHSYSQLQIPGITQVLFSSDASILYIIPRQSELIMCMDMRTPSRFWYLERDGRTNMRLYASFDSKRHRLLTGDNRGHLLSFSMDQLVNENETANEVFKPEWSQKIFDDAAVACVSAHPSKDVIAVASAKRSFNSGTRQHSLRIISVDS